MRKKLFTLLVALLVLGLQAKAQVIVGVHTGKADPPATQVQGAGPFNNERGGYAGTINDTPNKLTFDGTRFLYAPGAPSLVYGSDDRIVVSNPAVNFISFSNSTTTLTLSYKNVNYSQFVVFRGYGPNVRVLDYYIPDLATPTVNPGQVLSPQAFNNGNFEGFLAIQATGMVDDSDLLIVVHNKAGVLSLMPYGDYVDSLYSDLTRAANNYYPLYVKTEQLSGRWATPADFAGCKFWQFHSRGADTDGKVLTAYSAEEVEAETTNTGYSTFTVKQVDFVTDVAEGGLGFGILTNNIISHKYYGAGSKFQGINRDLSPTLWKGSRFYGTTPLNPGAARPDSVIPLFVLGTPDNDCKVLSVSRINRLAQESRQDGGYADRLEVRDYEEYFTWDLQPDNTYKYTSHSVTPVGMPQQGQPADVLYDTYTSLQKFAIWIDYDGRMTLYPAAAYFWKYGEYKGGENNRLEPGQPDDIRANAVLVYNDINVDYVANVTPIAQSDKLYGLQVTWWNGLRSVDPKASAQFTTGPNMPQTFSDYSTLPFELICWEDNKYIDQRFYFMQVYPDTVGVWNWAAAGGLCGADGWLEDGYQWNREYVLGTQWVPFPPGGGPALSPGAKAVAVVPKEVRREEEKDYWRFPYDSVNMAAHWEAVAVDINGDRAAETGRTAIGFRFINMLGDTLRYDTSDNTFLRGGYQTVNRLIPGADGSITGDLMGVKYFGRPDVEGTNPDYWFNESSLANTLNSYDIWQIHKLKDQKAFYLEFTDGSNVEYTLINDLNPGVLNYNGWYNGTVTCMDAGMGCEYFQQNVILDSYDPSVLYSHINGDFKACPGMKITLEEIYYVPTFGDKFYPDEPLNSVINTNDWDFQYQDSLTAYTFLTGFYHIVEALDVENTLALGYESVPIYDGLGSRVNAARLLKTEDVEKLEFIPLDSQLGRDREAAMRALWTGPGGFGDSLGVLYGETYKWYLIKSGDLYLTYDWVNYTARTNRETAGLIFGADLENATPVRLYQPLVGDKAESNFLFQFYIPNYKYYPGTATPVRATTFWEVEDPVLGVTRTASTLNIKDQVCFATLSNHSDYIYATRAYVGLTSGTRFTFIHLQTPPCDCIGEFIYPQWLGQERLLSLPLNNQLWENGKALTAWIATNEDDLAIVTNDGADKATTLTHNYVTTIREYSGINNVYRVPILGNTATSVTSTDVTWIGDVPFATAIPGSNTFFTDLTVDLYNIQNDEGLYLTVIAENDMSDPRATVKDVNGVKLGWREKYADSRNAINTVWGYDRRALQLFAISGCTDPQPDANNWYGEFIYLPLASYIYDYANLEFDLNALDQYRIDYNFNLGKEMVNANGCPSNDLRDCWRVAQYSWVGSNIKNLVVFNAFNMPVGGSMIPIQVKWQKQQPFKPQCDYYLVQNAGKGFMTGEYYTIDSHVSDADDNSMFAHWQIIEDTADEYLFTFVPEMEDIYGVPVGSAAIPQVSLTGEYYFVKEKAVDGGFEYVAIDVSGYGTAVYTAKFDTLKLICTDHALPFYDLEADGGFNLLNKLAILETPFVDRNITYEVMGEITPVWRGGVLIGYQTYIKEVNKSGKDFEDAEFLTVYKENRRELVKDLHIIPYYSFSITKDGKEYFLNVDLATSALYSDSVYWTEISDADKAKLIDWENNPDFMKLYKFCLPYQVDEDGNMADLVKYSDTEYPPVYLQTLDLTRIDYPYLVIAGAATKYVTSKNLWDAIKPVPRAATLNYNIYTVDYRYIDPYQVTAWIFGGQMPPDNVWVPIAEAVSTGTATGVLTNYKLGGGGVSFVDQSEETPVNYGILTGIKNAPDLTLEYGGTTLIGAFALRPIWYYRIKLGDDYLTDATGKVGSEYYYNFATLTYPYGFFGDKIDDYDPYFDAEEIKADEEFVQSFGFRYVDDSDGVQSFYIVSNADFSVKPTREDLFRYLAEINNQLVFVEDQIDALVFQWGGIIDGDYVDLKVVGQGGIFGVNGGVKFLDTTGKVDIYSIDGRLIKSAVLTGGEQIIEVPRGIAIVKNGTNAVKVAVQ